MRFKGVLILAAVIVFASLVGRSAGKGSAAWPATRPSDFTVVYSNSGGMLPEGQGATFSERGGFYDSFSGNDRTGFLFTVRKSEMDRLYEVFRDNHFDQIKTGGGVIYDKGGPSLHVRWEATSYGVGTSGTQILPSHQASWNRVLGATDDLLQQKRREATAPLEIELGSGFVGHQVEVSFFGSWLLYEAIEQSRTLHLKAMPGTYTVQVEVGPTSRDIPLEVPAKGKSILLDFKNNEITERVQGPGGP